MILIDYSYNNYWLYKIISTQKIKYAIWMSNARPILKSSVDNIFFIFQNQIYKIKKKIFSFFFRNDFFILPPDCILASGKKSIIYNHKKSSKTSILWAHTLDYDLYLEEMQFKRNLLTKKAVFIDENWVDYPDYLYYNTKPATTADEYYPILNSFFEFLEKKYNYEIIISAHHSADLEKYKRYYNNRKIYKGNTCELVRITDFSILSASTAGNFIIMFEKPCIFITTNSLEISEWGKFIHYYAYLFGKQVLNIDLSFDFDFTNEMIVNKQTYQKYKEDYIKIKESPDKYFWQMFADYLKENF